MQALRVLSSRHLKRRMEFQESGKVKGGPSKGGFLNKRLFFRMIYDLYTHTIHFIIYIYIYPYMNIIDYSGSHFYQDRLCLAPKEVGGSKQVRRSRRKIIVVSLLVVHSRSLVIVF